jgi:tetratricopeptide (TPR) repeat protein
LPYGVSFFQHGYLQQAEASFKQVIAAKPDNPELLQPGNAVSQEKRLSEAREYLERAVKVRPSIPKPGTISE